MERPRNGGFSLLEVLVAFAILGIFLAAMFPALDTSMHVTREANQRLRAVAIAEAQLAHLGNDEPLAIGSRHGVAGGMNWLEEIGPDTGNVDMASGTGADHPPKVKAFLVSVRVSWGAAPADGVTLTSLRLAKVATD